MIIYSFFLSLSKTPVLKLLPEQKVIKKYYEYTLTISLFNTYWNTYQVKETAEIQYNLQNAFQSLIRIIRKDHSFFSIRNRNHIKNLISCKTNTFENSILKFHKTSYLLQDNAEYSVKLYVIFKKE